jgi:hypothetical protein
MEFIIIFICVFVAIILLAVSIYFSKYKRRKTGCGCSLPDDSYHNNAPSPSCACSLEEELKPDKKVPNEIKE